MRRHAPLAAAFLAAVLATCVELDPEPECEDDCGGGGAGTIESLCAGRGCEKVVDPATGLEVVCDAALYCPQDGAAPACCAGRECATDSCADRGCREENSCGTTCLHACADWKQVVLPAEGGPLPRFGPAFALDPGSTPERPPLLLAVGGRVDDAGVQSLAGDSWALSFTETPHWEPLEATDPPVQNATLVFHPVVGRFLLFGGFLLPSAGATADLRSFDPAPTGPGSGWSLVTPDVSGGSPPARGAHCAAWDPLREELVVFGGVEATSAHDDPDNFRGDTWVLSGASPTSPGSWRDRTPALSPRPRFGAACAWDGVGVLLFGGAGLDRARFDDLWRWDGTGWTELSDGTGVGPEPRFGPMMAWDPAGARMLVYGGYVGDSASGDSSDESWEWSVPPEGTAARWLQHTGQTPSERRFGGIATLDPGIFPGSVVPATGGVVIFGGARSDTTLRNDVWLLQPALE